MNTAGKITNLKLEKLSALMMLLGKSAFDSDLVAGFIDRLDLSVANELYAKCLSICYWYDKVITNKKAYINRIIKQRLEQNDREHLILIPGAGKSPLALELLGTNNNLINRVLEIDIAGMFEKKEFYDHAFPDYSEKIKCISSDITSPVTLEVLRNCLNEFYSDMPCIIVLEGLSPFLSFDDLESVILTFKDANRNNLLIMDYTLDPEFLPETAKNIVTDLYSLINSTIGVKGSTYYSSEDIKKLVNECGASIIEIGSVPAAGEPSAPSDKFLPEKAHELIGCVVCNI